MGWPHVRAAALGLVLLTLQGRCADLQVVSGSLRVSLSKDNGAITSIYDDSTGVRLSDGSQNGCLFGLTDLRSQYVGGCSFSAAAGSFRSEPTANGGLELSYDDGTAKLGAFNVTVVPSSVPGGAGDAVDLTLRMLRPPAVRIPLTSLLWPSELLFAANRTSAVVLPVLPGLWLGQGTFGRPGWPSPSIALSYPGRGVHSDVAWIRMDASPEQQGGAASPAPRAVSLGAAGLPNGSASLAVLTVTDALPSPGVPGGVPGAARVIPSTLDLRPVVGASATRWFLSHGFVVNVTGSSAMGAAGVAFTTRLVRGATAGGAARLSAAAAGLDEPGAVPSLTSRLGGTEAAAWMAGAPLTKMDTTSLNRTFAEYRDGVLAPLTAPSLVHMASYEPHGFDRWYPDLLPPNRALGTTLDMRAVVRASRGLGHVFMPYTNPTWWDVESPTVVSQMPAEGVGLADVSALNASSLPERQCYGPNCGVAVSGASDFVRRRAADLVRQITTEDATRHGPGIGSDAIFCDQIGARPPYPDRSAGAAELAARSFGEWGAVVGGAAGFARGWQQIVWDNPGGLMHTEQGFDKLLVANGTGAGAGAGVAGFHGQNLLQSFSAGYAQGYCPGGTGNEPGADPDAGPCWRPVPLGAAALRGRVLLYQHDLANLLFDFTPLRLSWDAGMGLQLSRLVAQSPCTDPGAPCGWERLVATLHREVVAPLAEAGMRGFDVSTGPGGHEWWSTSLGPAPPGTMTGAAPTAAAAVAGPVSPFPAASATVVTNRAPAGAAALAASLGPIPGTLPTSLVVSVASPGAAWSVTVTVPAGAAASSVPWLPTSVGTVAGSFASPLFGRRLGPGNHTVVARLGALGVGGAGGCKPGAPAVALWYLQGDAASLPVPALAEWAGAHGLTATPVSRSVANRTVTFAPCGGAVAVGAPGPDGFVDVPAAAWTCQARDTLAVVC